MSRPDANGKSNRNRRIQNGKNFATFDDFREAFWIEVSKDKNLAAQFSKQNITRMEQGKAPIASQSQHLGKVRSYTLHHKVPIQRGGSVYDMQNIIIVTPRLHKDILDGKYHYGR